MKKIVVFAIAISLLSACSNSGNNSASTSDTMNSTNATDSTIVQPNGVTTGNVISTDTNSMDNAIRDSTK